MLIKIVYYFTFIIIIYIYLYKGSRYYKNYRKGDFRSPRRYYGKDRYRGKIFNNSNNNNNNNIDILLF